MEKKKSILKIVNPIIMALFFVGIWVGKNSSVSDEKLDNKEMQTKQ